MMLPIATLDPSQLTATKKSSGIPQGGIFGVVVNSIHEEMFKS